MQALYSAEINPIASNALQQALQKNLHNTQSLFLFSTLFLYKIAEEVNFQQQQQRSAKKYTLQNTAPELQNILLNNQIFINPLVQSLKNNIPFTTALQQQKTDLLITSEITLQQYNTLIKLPEYEKYCLLTPPTTADHQKMLKTIAKKLMWESENFVSYTTSLFLNFEDDKDNIWAELMLIINSFNEKKPHQHQIIPPNDDFSEKELFANQLLRLTLQNNQQYETLIIPELKNWELQRVAAVDLLLMKMCLTEFLYFDNIPTKVSINEYIEISKIYSSLKSKEFINGILDTLLKKLTLENKIRKAGRGLQS